MLKRCKRSILAKYRAELTERELARETVGKYVRDAERFLDSLGSVARLAALGKSDVVAYKESLMRSYAPSSVNTMLSSLNSFLGFTGHESCKVKHLRIQKETYRDASADLAKDEYWKLVAVADERARRRSSLAVQTLCSTGMRASELEAVTVEAVREGRVRIANKGKIRTAWLPEGLQRSLLSFARSEGLCDGPVFRARSGRPLSRFCLWREMQSLAAAAGIERSKAHPHNLRHLFARTFYEEFGDLNALGDLLGHARLETTRIYLMTTGAEHQREP